MKILIISQHFWPETFKINDLAIELKKMGHEVSVLTGKPNYPEGKYYKGYGLFKKFKESFNDIQIYRVPIIPRGRGSKINLIINYCSFVVLSVLFVLFHRNTYNLCFVFASSPITQVYPALLHKKIFKSSTVIWLQDIWPESVSAAGNINFSILLDYLERISKYIYKRSDIILVQSRAFIPILEKKGIDKEKIIYCPNWAEDIFLLKLKKSTLDEVKEKLPKGFIVLFSGNIGEAQGFECIVKAALNTQHVNEIKWVILGNGRKSEWLRSKIVELNLQDTLYMLGRYPVEMMPYFYYHADALLISLKDNPIFSVTIPAKLQTYMAFGKPIIGSINGICAEIIEEAMCGYVSKAGDYISLANNIIKIYHMNPEDLKKLGENGKRYYNINFNKQKTVELINYTINSL